MTITELIILALIDPRFRNISVKNRTTWSAFRNGKVDLLFTPMGIGEGAPLTINYKNLLRGKGKLFTSPRPRRRKHAHSKRIR